MSGNKQLMDFDLLTPFRGEQCESDLLIYFVLSGSLSVVLKDFSFTLAEDDFAIVDAYRPHSLELREHPLVMRFALDLSVLSDYYDIGKTAFSGSSAEERSGRTGELKGLLKKCIACYYGKRAREGRILLRLNSIYYEIAELLVSAFSVVKSGSGAGDGKDFDGMMIDEIAGFIQSNFRSPLKLEELSEHFYLSPAYMSRFFKKKIGINFAKYLEGIRLSEAVRELENTQKPMTRVAMDCGFPNLAAFNRAFKERYGMNPKDYRESRRWNHEEGMPPYGKTDPAERQLLDYLEKNEDFLEEDQAETDEVEASTDSVVLLAKTWNRMINIGGVSMLLQKEVQDQTEFLCRTLGFEYVRVWDLYEASMHINAGNRSGKYNFSRLDRCLDFLTGCRLKPYLELGFKPFVLLKDYGKFLFDEQREIPFTAPEEYGAFIRSLLLHLINRYGLKELSGWIFEVWCDPRWFPQGDPTEYIRYFEQAYQAVRELSPMSRIGGGYDRMYGVIDFERLIQRWSMRGIQPDFLSVYCYPTIMMEGMAGENTALEEQRNYRMKQYLENRRHILEKYGMKTPLTCSEWNFTVINANVLNDSSFKGAYVMKTIMDTYEETDLWGYWFGTDLFVEEDDAPLLLNGRCGLITHQGICKPAYWAMRFMNRLENYLLKKTANIMATMDEFGNYVLALHNYKKPDIQYYVQKERDVSVESIPHLFENVRRRIVKIKISGVKNGVYHIKSRVVNSQYGCAQSEWLRMNKSQYLTPEDVEYIGHVSRPHITIAEQEVTDHTLRITAELDPQEIRLIHAFPRIKPGE